MKAKYLFLTGCICLGCLVIGMICGTLIERRHFNFWFPPDERVEVQAAIEKARWMMTELEEIENQIKVWNEEKEKSVTWNDVALKMRPNDGD